MITIDALNVLRIIVALLVLVSANSAPAVSRSAKSRNAKAKRPWSLFQRRTTTKKAVPRSNSVLEKVIEAHEKQKREIGVVVFCADDDSVVLSHNATKPMVPASNLKLLTTAVALRDWNDTLVWRLRRKLGNRGRLVWQTPVRRGRNRLASDTVVPEPYCYPETDSASGLKGFDLLCRINKMSDNRVANRLLNCVTEAEGGRTGASVSPTDLMRIRLDSMGIWSAGLNVIDGSGRSPENRTTPLTLVQVLTTMYQSECCDVFLKSLAIGGTDGTLRRHGLVSNGLVRAKTGSISGTYSLSGYCQKMGKTYVFSIILNQWYDKKGAFDFFSQVLETTCRSSGVSV